LVAQDTPFVAPLQTGLENLMMANDILAALPTPERNKFWTKCSQDTAFKSKQCVLPLKRKLMEPSHARFTGTLQNTLNYRLATQQGQMPDKITDPTARISR
jgi:hypothetical protein